MEPRDIPDDRSVRGDRDLHRKARVIGGCEFDVVRRELWDTEDLEKGRRWKDRESLGHRRSGTCGGSHRIWPYRSRALIRARKSAPGQGGEQLFDKCLTNWNLAIRYYIPNTLIEFLLDIWMQG